MGCFVWLVSNRCAVVVVGFRDNCGWIVRGVIGVVIGDSVWGRVFCFLGWPVGRLV